LQRQSGQLFSVQTEIATQKRLNKPSDDPGGMARVLDYRSQIAVIEQYLHNIGQGQTLVQTTELTLDLIDDLIDLAREIAQTHGNPGSSPAVRQLAANEVRNLYQQLVEVINTKSGSDYIFSGHQTDTPSFAHVVELDAGVPQDIIFGLSAGATDAVVEIRDQNGAVVRTLNLGDGVTPGSGGSDGINAVAWNGLDDGGVLLPDGQYSFTITASDAGDSVKDYVTYNGDDGRLAVIVGENMEVYLDMDGRNFFAPGGGVDLFELMADLVDALENPDPVAGSSQILATVEQLDTARVQLNNKRTEFGPKLYRLEHSANHWSNLSVNLEINIGRIENADITKAAVQLQNLELAYQSTLATAARMIQPGILNFLR
jgi:flagellar hook-associated protein 3 FlgL